MMIRDEINTKRPEWIEAYQPPGNLMITQLKEESLMEFLPELEDDLGAAQDMPIIRSLSGSPDGTAPNEALIQYGKLIISPEKDKLDG